MSEIQNIEYKSYALRSG